MKADPPPDPIFSAVARMHGDAPWGDILDAGTGHTSLRWMVTLATSRWTAVTGESVRAANLESQIKDRKRPQDRLLVGNWRDPSFLAGESFDVVMADYLLGAVERYAPYFQFALLRRLRELTRKRLYLVGLEPYSQPLDQGQEVVNEIAHFRDACHLHNSERFHREFPLEWSLERLKECQFTICGVEKFPILYGRHFIEAELGLAKRLIERLAWSPLRKALLTRHGEIRDRAYSLLGKLGGLPGGFDYLIAADPSA